MPLPDLLAGVYQHYKGQLYLVEGYARHSETDEVFVLYTPLYVREGPRKCVRPVSLFFDSVDGVPRFRYVGPQMPEEEEASDG